MRTHFDQYAKAVLREALQANGDVRPELEIAIAPQRADVYFEARDGGGLEPPEEYRELFARLHEVDCLLEHCHDTPGLDEIRDCVRKLLSLHHLRRLEASRGDGPPPRLPRLWVVSPGRPEAVIDGFALARPSGWPPGFFEGPLALGLRLVVLRELPRTRETLLLRLLAPVPALREALPELVALPQDAWERRVVVPHLIAWRIVMEQDLQGLTSEEEGLMADLQEVYRQWEEKERREGQRQTLLKQLAVRFGAVSDAAVRCIQAATAEQLDRWTERVLTAGRLEEVLGEG